MAWFEKPCDVHFPIALERTPDWPKEVQNFVGKGLGDFWTWCMAIIFLAVFSSIHLSAWNYGFPTITEAWLWRAFSVTLFVLPAMVLYIVARDVPENTAILVLLVCVTGIYISARIFLIVESFLAFRSANPGIYAKVEWSSYWGHVGS
jgi:hypothetical protein